MKSHLHKGRGATVSPSNRFQRHQHVTVDDGWTPPEDPAAPKTCLHIDNSKTVITYNKSPDISFDRSINPYRGCEHGCVYCFARPTHAYLDLSPGLDFETQLFYKPNAVEQLRSELSRKNYQCAPITVGINTDAYQPIEKKLELTRRILEVLVELQHPFMIVTKSALIERDIDLISQAAQRRQAGVAISLTSLDEDLSRRLEPRTAAPKRRLRTIARLSDAGVPVSVLMAPLIPVLTDPEMETILQSAADAGASSASYVLLRLPHELKQVFHDWLYTHYPLKAEHVINRLRECRQGKDYDARFGSRMRGQGVYADLLARRFELAVKRYCLQGNRWDLDCGAFVRSDPSGQMGLFE